MRYLRYLSVCLQSGFWTINSMLGVAIWSHIEFNQAYSCHHSNVCTIAQYYPTNWHQELILHPPKLNIAKYQKMMGFGQSISGFHYQLFWEYSYVKFPLVTSPHQKKKKTTCFPINHILQQSLAFWTTPCLVPRHTATVCGTLVSKLL